MSYIRVNNVGKAYRQYHSKTGRLIEWLSPLNTKRHNLKWILSDINFEVAPGEAVGIIGINGAGKSALLKLITGTSRPTTGEIEISGRVAALLELGMGFHSDFTGRQNVYMSGQLLGLSSEKITELMPQIEEFAEIGDYIDQPVRVYSSGMQVRLAFSVATAIRPDVLIIDEALSVGDAYFQHKSFDKIKEFKSLTRQNYSQTSSYTKVKNEFEAKFKNLEATKQKDGAIISAFEAKFDKDKFIEFASKFFSEVSLSKIEESDNNASEKFFRFRLNVTSSLRTPQKFYDFLDALSSYDSIVKTEFPIVMKGEKDKIHTTFNIKVFGLK